MYRLHVRLIERYFTAFDASSLYNFRHLTYTSFNSYS